jgi:hypothetical protein
MEDQFPLGVRVFLKGGHPWKGHTGVVVRYMDTPIGRLPVVRLDECRTVFPGMEAAISHPDWARVLKKSARGRQDG